MPTEKQLLQSAMQKLGARVLSDLGSMPKALKKKARKDKIQALQNNAFKKGKKK